MIKKIICILFSSLVIAACLSNSTTGPGATSLFKELSGKADQRYSVWKANKDGSDSRTLFYGLEGSYRTVSSRTNGLGLASGWDQIIFYRNVTANKDLAAITIAGRYTGDPGKQWSFSVEDFAGTVLFASPQFRFDLFPGDRFNFVEFDAVVPGIPEDFIIRIKTHSDPTDSLFILLVDEDQKHRHFSYEYWNDQNYKVVEKGNYAVFPEFK